MYEKPIHHPLYRLDDGDFAIAAFQVACLLPVQNRWGTDWVLVMRYYRRAQDEMKLGNVFQAQKWVFEIVSLLIDQEEMMEAVNVRVHS